MKSLLLLSGLGLAALAAELFGLKKWLPWLVLAGLLATIGAGIYDWNTDIHYFNNMLGMDNYAILFSILLCGIALLWFFAAKPYFENETNLTDQFALVLFSLTGAFVMVSFNHLVMLFLGIEIMSLSFYVLAGSRKNDLFSNEAALKYFIMGSFSTGFLLFGIALIYGASGSFHTEVIGQVFKNPANVNGWVYTGLLLIMIGMIFKISAAPLHFWAPDVYYGSPSMITALMATIGKTAAFAAFYRLFSTSFVMLSGYWVYLLMLIAVLTMFAGNISALVQDKVKRMLAYSSVAHAGYLLLALTAQNKISAAAIGYYLTAYSIASLISFLVLYIATRHSKGEGVEVFKRLGKKSRLSAMAMTVAMLSLAGIPPLAGFFGKYYVFASAFMSGHYTLVVLAVVASVISLFYYLRIVIAMYSTDENEEEQLVLEPAHRFALVMGSGALVVLGVFPEFIISFF